MEVSNRSQLTSRSDRLEAVYRWERAGEHGNHAYLWPSVRRILSPRPSLKILDAGCGNGFITARLAAMGYDVLGLDASPSGIALARAEYPNVRFELFSVYDKLDALAPPGGWDLIVSLEVIEHLFAPREFLENMRRYLNPAGSLLLSTPYHGYAKNLALSIVNGWDRHHTVDWDCGHIKFFSAASLGKILARAGFEMSQLHYSGRVPFLWKSMIGVATPVI